MGNKLKLQNIIKHIKTMFYNLVSGQFKKSQIDTISWWLKKRYNLIPMRELSESEKNIIKRLNDWELLLKESPATPYNIDITVLIHDLLKIYNGGYKFDDVTSVIKIFNTPWDAKYTLNDNNKLRRDFMSMVYFLDYLKSERLIYLVPPEETSDLSKNDIDFTINGRTDYVTKIEDSEFITLFKEFYGKVIFPTEYIIKYYKNDCRTDEEVRFKDTMYIANEGVKKAKQSLRVAIGLGVVSILLTLFTTFKPNSDTQLILTKIDNVKVSNDTKLILTEISKLSRKVEIGDSLLGLRIDKIDNRLTNLEKRVDKLEIKPNR